MTTSRSAFRLLGLSAALLLPLTASADEAHKKNKESVSAAAPAKGTLAKVSEKDAAWAAKQRPAYPLAVCVTSDEKLGAMGENAEFIYREPGKPDRLVIFCCEGCGDDFAKEPTKFLAKIDAAAKQKAGK